MLCRAKSRLHKLTPASDTHKSITIVTKQPYFNFSFLVMRGTSSFLDVAALVAAILLYSRLYSNREVTLVFWSLKSCPCLYWKTLLLLFMVQKNLYRSFKSDRKFRWFFDDGCLKSLQTNSCRKINSINSKFMECLALHYTAV